jgi:hypothetical protein
MITEKTLHVDVDEGYRVKVYGKVGGKYDEEIADFKHFRDSRKAYKPFNKYVSRIYNNVPMEDCDDKWGYVVSSGFLKAINEEDRGLEPPAELGTCWFSYPIVDIIDTDDLFLFMRIL